MLLIDFLDILLFQGTLLLILVMAADITGLIFRIQAQNSVSMVMCIPVIRRQTQNLNLPILNFGMNEFATSTAKGFLTGSQHMIALLESLNLVLILLLVKWTVYQIFVVLKTGSSNRASLNLGGLTGFLGRLIFGKVKKWRLKISLKFPRVKTEEWRPAQSVKINCEDCILKCEDPKINSCWLDPQFGQSSGNCAASHMCNMLWECFISFAWQLLN